MQKDSSVMGSVEIIRFPTGQVARLIRASPGVPPDVLLERLGLGLPRALIVLCGGAGGMTPQEIAVVRPLLVDGLARLAAREQIAILDGGTNSGVMALIGEGIARYGLMAPLIGVCPAAKVSWPGNPNPHAEAELEPHHSHFVLTPGDEFGAETEFLYGLAEALGKQAPSLALVINGGRITLRETWQNILQGRPVVVVKGSGRIADVLAAAWERGESDDPLIAEILRKGDISIFDARDGPESLTALVQRKLQEEHHVQSESL